MRGPGLPGWGVSNDKVRHGHTFWGTWTRKWLNRQVPEAIVRVITDPSSRQGRRPTTSNPQMSGGYNNLVMGQRLVLNTNLNISKLRTCNWLHPSMTSQLIHNSGENWVKWIRNNVRMEVEENGALQVFGFFVFWLSVHVEYYEYDKKIILQEDIFFIC
jgi:hypothetical protein